MSNPTQSTNIHKTPSMGEISDGETDHDWSESVDHLVVKADSRSKAVSPPFTDSSDVEDVSSVRFDQSPAPLQKIQSIHSRTENCDDFNFEEFGNISSFSMTAASSQISFLPESDADLDDVDDDIETEEDWDDGFEGDLDLSHVNSLRSQTSLIHSSIIPLIPRLEKNISSKGLKTKPIPLSKTSLNTTISSNVHTVAPCTVKIIRKNDVSSRVPKDSSPKLSSSVTSHNTKQRRHERAQRREMQPQKHTPKSRQGPTLIRLEDVSAISSLATLQWNPAISLDVGDEEEDWGDGDTNDNDVSSVKPLLLPIKAVSHPENELSVSANVGKSFTRASLPADFAVDAAFGDSLTATERTHNEVMSQIVGPDWRETVGSLRSAVIVASPNVSHPSPPVHSRALIQPQSSHYPPGEKLTAMSRVVTPDAGGRGGSGLPSWLQEGGGPVVAVHDVHLDLECENEVAASEECYRGSNCVPAKARSTMSSQHTLDVRPKTARSALDKSAKGPHTASTKSSLSGSQLLSSAKLSKARKTTLKRMWEFAGEL